jgi:radical SAM protein with 4Fe4S-binding SPASM domain
VGFWRFLFSNTTTKPATVPGVYHYTRSEGESKVRIHLRIEADGNAALLVNASRIYYLNAVASMMAFFTLEGYSPNQVISEVSKHYRVRREKVAADYEVFRKQLEWLISPGEVCPIHDLELETLPPFSARSSAPYRMDIAITYRCNNWCEHCYNARPRTYPEMDTAFWLAVIDRLWSLGIPHIVFTGGEPTTRKDLPQLIAYAETRGQITGLNTNGRRLKDEEYLQSLVDAGLDHVQITIESHNPDIHDQMVGYKGAWEETVQGLKKALNTSLFVMTNTTLLAWNAKYLAQTLDFLAELGVQTVGLNGLIRSGGGTTISTGIPEERLGELLSLAREKTAQNHQRLIWYTPTRYCNFDPVLNGLGLKGCTAAWYNMCIEPDGQVLPCQSYYFPLGHILHNDWQTIWNHDLAIALRERHYLPEGCTGCALIRECGGGCPLTYLGNNTLLSEFSPISRTLNATSRSGT